MPRQPAAPKPDRKPKVRIDPKVKAQLALDVQKRAHAKVDAKIVDLSHQLATAREERDTIEVRLAYLASDPLLKQDTDEYGTEPLIPAQQDHAEL